MKVYRDKRIISLFLFPAMLLIVVFIYYPLVQSVINSLYKWSSFSPTKDWVGMANYTRMFTDPIMYQAIWNNTLYAIISIICQTGLGLVFAACLEEKFMRKYQNFFRTVLFLPSVISMSVIGLMWQLIYNPNFGLVNAVIKMLGYEGFNHAWLGSASTALLACIFVSQWQYTGYIMLLDIVAIQKVPQELFESATIDGANRAQIFFKITIPQIKEGILVSTIITIIGAYKVFTEVYVMTVGGPGRASEVLVTMMYRNGFRNDEMGYASAFAIFVFLITFILTVLQLTVSRSGKD